MSQAISDIGFVGLGNMGGAIAGRLLSSGAALHVYDSDAATLERFSGLGAFSHSSPQGVADAADVVFTCLPHLAACREVTLGGSGLVKGSRIRVFVEMSTVGPNHLRDYADILSKSGIRTLDAPVSGGASAARSGSLTIMTAGEEALHALLEPILSRISTSVIAIGDRPGDAQTMKLVNNLLAAANMATAFEALTLGCKLGLSPTRMADVVMRSSGASTGFTRRRIDAITSRRFDNGGKIALLEKDIALAFEQAEQAGFPIHDMPALSGMAKLWEAAGEAGMSGDDVTALVKLVERAAGIEVREDAARS
ncbi:MULTISPECIES: NAD(P)-dependent oxidoreductase [unclassified Chelatococcus]|uniref:NAD(P)-dependent oxidoreductase n=1 Tax=unclassified Chelatococcus TaxID=2638111 RepID=UPI001BD122F6|nr:NAD(P)-dependent oxidoreductase [Chelatococcus sp.]MBS7743506.1 NAD(P)-dependent oxidoreductase [Chelatococcus sp. HY11]MBX3547376.1 NAD(P)-dependent oxidoreductase [Chelatococcus sp.]